MDYRSLAIVADEEADRRALLSGRKLNKRKALATARRLLTPDRRQDEAYPVEALGPLAPACAAIAEHGQMRPAMAGQCLLAAASLLTQGLWNVQTLTGPKPLSLYMLSLGDSGDGKSTGQAVALHSVNEWQRDAAKNYANELKDFERAKAARKKGDGPPDPPMIPFRLVGDATVEGLRRDLDTGPCSQGVFSDEAAAILSGYGMSPDHRAKTAGVFSKLWDEGHLSVSRVTGGRVERYGRRVALHWLVQPMAAAEALGDPLLSALGFWPRFLLAWPTTFEPRRPKVFDPEKLPEVKDYWRRCDALLAMPLAEDAGKCAALPLGSKAMSIVKEAFARFELEGRRGELVCVKPFALRATEQLCRIGGVLAAFGCREDVCEDDARGALALVLHSLDTWRSIVEQGLADPVAANALRLYAWLLDQPNSGATTTDILKRATPHTLRHRDTRDAALELLQAHELIDRDGPHIMAMTPESDDAQP